MEDGTSRIKIRVARSTGVKALGFRLFKEHSEGRGPFTLCCMGEGALRVAFQAVMETNKHLVVNGGTFFVFPVYVPSVEGDLEAFGLELHHREVT